MQLAGNPSLIDPTKAIAKPRAKPPAESTAKDPKVIAALAKLSDEDRALAEKQRICPVTEAPLGSMGTPPKVDVDGRTVFICCEGCRKSLLEEREKYLAILDAAAAKPAASEGPSQGGMPPIGSIQAIEAPPIGSIEILQPPATIPETQPQQREGAQP